MYGVTSKATFLNNQSAQKKSYTENKEYGLGRPDIVIIPKDKDKTACVFEFKWDSIRGSKTLDTLANEAVTEIKE